MPGYGGMASYGITRHSKGHVTTRVPSAAALSLTCIAVPYTQFDFNHRFLQALFIILISIRSSSHLRVYRTQDGVSQHFGASRDEGTLKTSVWRRELYSPIQSLVYLVLAEPRTCCRSEYYLEYLGQ